MSDEELECELNYCGDKYVRVDTAKEYMVALEAQNLLLKDTNKVIAEENQRLRRDWEEEEASICPEDVGYREYIGVLQKRGSDLEAENARQKEQLLSLGSTIGDLRMEIASLQSELASRKLKWQTGRVPKFGKYMWRWAESYRVIYGNSMYLTDFEPSYLEEKIEWAGPIEMPEEGRNE